MCNKTKTHNSSCSRSINQSNSSCRYCANSSHPHDQIPETTITDVLLRTPITQMIFFNQGMLLLSSNLFLLTITFFAIFSFYPSQVMCVPLFYIQQLCAAARLTFNVKVTHRMPRVSKSYPTQLTVHIGQTVTNNATLSAHVSTWFHESGFDTKGNVMEFYRSISSF